MSLLVDQVRDQIRTLHYSIRTEEAYLKWIRQFILFHGKRHRLAETALQKAVKAAWTSVQSAKVHFSISGTQ